MRVWTRQRPPFDSGPGYGRGALVRDIAPPEAQGRPERRPWRRLAQRQTTGGVEGRGPWSSGSFDRLRIPREIPSEVEGLARGAPEAPRAAGVFVTGTDTGVGKTVVACALAAWCRWRGLDVGVMKPVATGGASWHGGAAGRWVSSDARRLARAARAEDSWSLMNPYCFREPLAPWTASQRDGRPIRIGRIVEAFAELSRRHQVVIVEGIGGLLVPLTAETSVGDLALRIGLPLLVVARPGIGTLNHTSLTVQCARRAGLTVLGIVVNHTREAPRRGMAHVVQRTNCEALERLTRAPLVGCLPFHAELQSAPGAHGALIELVERRFDRRALDRVLGVGVDRAKRLWYSQPHVVRRRGADRNG